MNLKVFVLSVLDGDHVESRPVGEHQAARFLNNKSHTRRHDTQVKVMVNISIMHACRVIQAHTRAQVWAQQVALLNGRKESKSRRELYLSAPPRGVVPATCPWRR